MVSLLEQLFSVVWHEEAVPRQWRESFIVNLKMDREDPGNYRGIEGKVLFEVLNNRLVQCLDKEGVHGCTQGGFGGFERTSPQQEKVHFYS